MKVKIIKCTVDLFWYKDRIGEIYDVDLVQLPEYGPAYKIKNGVMFENYLNYDDCVDITKMRKDKFNRILQ